MLFKAPARHLLQTHRSLKPAPTLGYIYPGMDYFGYLAVVLIEGHPNEDNMRHSILRVDHVMGFTCVIHVSYMRHVSRIIFNSKVKNSKPFTYITSTLFTYQY